MVVEDQAGALREVERVGQGEGEERGRHRRLGEAARHAERGHALTGDVSPSSAACPLVSRTTPATSPPGTNGSGGLYWYSPRVCSTSGKETPAACTSITTPSPGVNMCDGGDSGTADRPGAERWWGP